MKRNTIFTLIFSLFSLFILNLFAQEEPEITVQELKDHIYYLASDSLKGRKPGTPEGKLAAEYIRNQFISFGLNPIGEDGFQYFEVIMSVQPGENNRGNLNGAELILEQDFYPSAFSSNKEVNAEVVFAGFGIDMDHDSIQWNDYKDLDVVGKWVLVLRGDPGT